MKFSSTTSSAQKAFMKADRSGVLLSLVLPVAATLASLLALSLANTLLALAR
ncbi:hypothetical protein [Undibacterium sp.]|uniref:hypothetical protein n=1 Tax=Undibacterium sp. TaxID=1914977 RepID=UPI0037512F05